MIIGLAARPARADAVHDLGDAFRAYDAGDLAAARAKLTGLDDSGLAIRDYALWLRSATMPRSHSA